MKSLYIINFLLAFAASTLITACSSDNSSGDASPLSDLESVRVDTENLVIFYGASDSATGVTSNITLAMEGPNGTTISWSSSDVAIVAISGVVSRPLFGTANKMVSLTATVIKNDAEDTKIFALTVLMSPQSDQDAVAADKAVLDIVYSGNDSANSVTQNISLATTGSSGTSIQWASDKLAIATDGTVTRPLQGAGNTAVTLVATIIKNVDQDTKNFSVTVVEATGSLCGDGVIELSEICDDFNASSCGTCNANCSVQQLPASASGTITTIAKANIIDGETFTIRDGLNAPFIFEFDVSGNGGPNFTIDLSAVVTADQVRDAIITAINGIGDGFNIIASSGGASIVAIANTNQGSMGNTASNESVANNSFVITNMLGGSGFDCSAGTGCLSNSDCTSLSCTANICD